MMNKEIAKLQTVAVLIGNSDNKLTQNMWAHYVASARRDINTIAYEIHFDGGSDNDSPFQNRCFVFTLPENKVNELKQKLALLASAYEQDSVAMLESETKFIPPAKVKND